MLQEEFMNGYGLDINSRCVSINNQVADSGHDSFIEVNLMPEYLGEPDGCGFRKPTVSYADVEGTEYLEVDAVDKDGNPLHCIGNYMSDVDVHSFLDGYEAAVKALCKKTTVYESVQQIKKREQRELAATLRKHGEPVDGGFEWHFEDDRPIIAAYIYDDPCDVYVNAARVDKDENIILIVCGVYWVGDTQEIEPYDVFAGHLDYVTSAIGA